MYRPSMASWLTSIAQRLPLGAIPTPKQVELAKQFTQQPELPGINLSLSTVHTLVWAQAFDKQATVDGRLPPELMAAMTWNREIVRPNPLRLQQLQREPCLPAGALAALAGLPQQTSYLLIERPGGGCFITGAWLMADLALESEEKILQLLMDLVVDGKPVRDVLFDFTLQSTVEAAIEVKVEETARTQRWDLSHGAIARRENFRRYVDGMRAVLAAFYDTFIIRAGELARARASAQPDELGFSFLDLSGGASAAMARGVFH